MMYDSQARPREAMHNNPSICSTKCQSGCNFGTDGEPSHLPTRAITALREGGKNMCGAGVAEHVGSVEPWGERGAEVHGNRENPSSNFRKSVYTVWRKRKNTRLSPRGGRRKCTYVHNESAHDIEGHRRGKQAPREGLPTGVLPQPPRRRAQWNPVSRSSVIRREGVFER